MKISTEELAYWYFRLNGCLTTVNFLIHPETQRDSSTDVDVLAVRFPYRAENLTRPMQDDQVFLNTKNRAYVIIGEVKRGQCDLNGPWTSPTSHNMEKILMAVGTFPAEQAPNVAREVRQHGFFSDCVATVSLFCIGQYPNERIHGQYPSVPQITWDHILKFIHSRFRDYRREKAQHSQWNRSGQDLWRTAEECARVEKFIAKVEIVPKLESQSGGA